MFFRTSPGVQFCWREDARRRRRSNDEPKKRSVEYGQQTQKNVFLHVRMTPGRNSTSHQRSSSSSSMDLPEKPTQITRTLACDCLLHVHAFRPSPSWRDGTGSGRSPTCSPSGCSWPRSLTPSSRPYRTSSWPTPTSSRESSESHVPA